MDQIRNFLFDFECFLKTKFLEPIKYINKQFNEKVD